MADHPDPDIRSAIEDALDRDWRLVKAGARAHVWGRLFCPSGARGGCIRAVYSTPRNPEDHAKDIRRAVDRCPH